MLSLGVLLLILALVLDIALPWQLGIVLTVIGLILAVLGVLGVLGVLDRSIGPRRRHHR